MTPEQKAAIETLVSLFDQRFYAIEKRIEKVEVRIREIELRLAVRAP